MTYVNPAARLAALEAEDLTIDGRLDALETDDTTVDGRLDVIEADSPRWRRFTISHTALQAAALTNDIQLLSLPSAGVIHAVRMRSTVSFVGGAISAYSLSLGIVGNLVKYAPLFDFFPAAPLQQFSSIVGTEDPIAATSIRLAATAVGANLDQSTGGSIDISVLYGKS